MAEFKVGEIIQHKLTSEKWIIIKIQKNARYLCRNSKYGTRILILEELEAGTTEKSQG